MDVKAYIEIARIDHWFKNIFMLPGIVLVMYFVHRMNVVDFSFDWVRIGLGVFATCLVASSNYVINEILDREKDLHHPVKKTRPVPSGRVKLSYGYAEWILLGVLGIGLGFWINTPFGLCALLLWVMGCLYNIPPIRTKDLAYGDVVSESVNNPIRLALGWYATGFTAYNPPLSVLLAYWMFGAFLMAMKRFAEFRMIDDPKRAGEYRDSFRWYTEERLLESIFFYAAMFGMLSGIFMTRYRVELILATPMVAFAMAYYMHLGFKPDSPVQTPENLYREKKLIVIVILAFGMCTALLLFDIDFFTNLVEQKMKFPVGS